MDIKKGGPRLEVGRPVETSLQSLWEKVPIAWNGTAAIYNESSGQNFQLLRSLY